MFTVTIPTTLRWGIDREKTLEQIKKCGAHRMAIAVSRELDYAFSSPKSLDTLKDNIAFFKNNGIEVIAWIGETFGHDKSQVGEDYASKYSNQRLVGQGRVTAFCPLDRSFFDDVCNWAESVASCDPDMIIVDDDFRLNGGCLCELHMQRIRERLGEDISAEELCRKAFVGGKNRYRDAYIYSQGSSMRELAAGMRRAVDRVNPKLRLGICATPFLWDSDGCDVEEIACIMAGDNKPFVRLFGAPYHAYMDNRILLGEIIEHERSQIAELRGKGIEVLVEGDTWPRPRITAPAAYLECFDTALRADGEASGILKYMLDYFSDPTYESGYVNACVKNAELYEKIDKMFSDKTSVGVRPYLARRTLENAEMNGIGDLGLCIGTNVIKCGGSNFNPSRSCGGNYNPTLELAIKNSLPVTYEDGAVNIVFGENARYVSEEELGNGSIIDLRAAQILTERGIDVGVEEFCGIYGAKAGIMSGFVGYYPDENIHFRLGGSAQPALLRLKPRAEAQSYLKNNVGERAPFIFRYENFEGKRFLVFPFEAYTAAGRDATTSGYLDGYALSRMLVRNVEWLGGKPLDAYCVGDYPLLYIAVKKNEKGLSVGLWNLFEDAAEGVKIKLNVDSISKLELVNCTGSVSDGCVRLDGSIQPFAFAGFEVTF